jgi:hypothetical protein
MNKELYTAAMNHLPVPADFTDRIIEKAHSSKLNKPKRLRHPVFAVVSLAMIAVILCRLLMLSSFFTGFGSSGGNSPIASGGGTDFGPGVKHLSSYGDTLYFQPYYGRAKTNSVFCWDGKTLTETPAKNTGSMFAYSQGCYYVKDGVLYRYEKGRNQITKVRDLNNDRRLGDFSTRENFTVRLFYADENGIYAVCYGSGNNSTGDDGESPFFLLRISPDGVKASMIYADGKGETGTYLSDIKVLDGRIYYSTSGGFYSLAMSGGDKRLVTVSSVSQFYGYSGGLVFIGQQPNQADPIDSLFSINRDGTKETRITTVSSTAFLTVQNNKVYYTLAPADHSVLYSGIYAYDLAIGKSEYVMDNKQENEKYTGDYYYQALPANNGIFMVHMGGEVCYYDASIKRSISIYGA